MDARPGSGFLLLVRIQRVAVTLKHLVVAITQLLRDNRTLAVFARSTDDSPTPSVVRTTVPLDALVVHEAEVVSGVLAVAAGDGACSVEFRRSHSLSPIPFPGRHYIIARYRALGNGIAVPCLRWIGERIELVERTLAL
jgi:hypothetical protein